MSGIIDGDFLDEHGMFIYDDRKLQARRIENFSMIRSGHVARQWGTACAKKVTVDEWKDYLTEKLRGTHQCPHCRLSSCRPVDINSHSTYGGTFDPDAPQYLIGYQKAAIRKRRRWYHVTAKENWASTVLEGSSRKDFMAHLGPPLAAMNRGTSWSKKTPLYFFAVEFDAVMADGIYHDSNEEFSRIKLQHSISPDTSGLFYVNEVEAPGSVSAVIHSSTITAAPMVASVDCSSTLKEMIASGWSIGKPGESLL